jgi:hypothetical protein
MPEAEYRVSPDLYLAALAPLYGQVRRLAAPQGCWRVHGQNHTWRAPFDARLRDEVRRWDRCFAAMARRAGELGLPADPEAWCRASWFHRIAQAVAEIAAIVPVDDCLILVDEDQWTVGPELLGRRVLPFLERDGQYWGAPPDDATAVAELERLRRAGAAFIAFAWPSFWWLDHYPAVLVLACALIFTHPEYANPQSPDLHRPADLQRRPLPGRGHPELPPADLAGLGADPGRRRVDRRDARHHRPPCGARSPDPLPA